MPSSSDDHDIPVPGFGPDRCAAYLDAASRTPVRELLQKALAHVPRRGRSLDVGCGPGREVELMLAHGLEVEAIDPSREMLELAKTRVGDDRVSFTRTTVELFAPTLRDASLVLVHAGFVLPFVRAADFPGTFAHLRRALAPGGVIVAQFFGPDDEFIRETGRDDMTAHDAAELDALLVGLTVLHREEVNRSGFVGKGRPKWWHVHHVIARREG